MRNWPYLLFCIFSFVRFFLDHDFDFFNVTPSSSSHYFFVGIIEDVSNITFIRNCFFLLTCQILLVFRWQISKLVSNAPTKTTTNAIWILRRSTIPREYDASIAYSGTPRSSRAHESDLFSTCLNSYLKGLRVAVTGANRGKTELENTPVFFELYHQQREAHDIEGFILQESDLTSRPSLPLKVPRLWPLYAPARKNWTTWTQSRSSKVGLTTFPGWSNWMIEGLTRKLSSFRNWC